MKRRKVRCLTIPVGETEIPWHFIGPNGIYEFAPCSELGDFGANASFRRNDGPTRIWANGIEVYRINERDIWIESDGTIDPPMRHGEELYPF